MWIHEDSLAYEKATRAYFDRLATLSEHPVFVHLLDGKVVQTNEKLCKLLGYSRDELLALTMADITEDLPFRKFKELMNHVLVNRVAATAIRFRKKSGNAVDTNAGLHFFSLRNTIYVVNRIRTADTMGDTDRIELSEANQKDAHFEALTGLAGGIAHDFNNLLMIIMGNASMARANLRNNQLLAKTMRNIERACSQAHSLTRQLRTFAKGGSPVTSINSVEQILRDTVEFCLRGSGVRVHLDVPSNIWNCRVDKHQISQVVQNLVVNARQAMNERGMMVVSCRNRPSFRIPATLLPRTDYVEITVEDSGPGIPDELMDRVFHPYFTTKANGQGLGLAMVYSIVRRHAGYVECANRTGAETGAKFTIYLPAAPSEQVHEETTRIPVSKKANGRVLVVEDEREIREIYQMMLESLGYRVTTAETGEAAIREYERAMLNRNPYDVVLLDLIIHGGSGGLETIEKLREIDPEVRGVVCSAYGERDELEDYRSYGFVGSLAKPFGLVDLQRACVNAMTNP